MGTHFNGSQEEINALNTYIKLTRAAESVNGRLKNLLLKEGVTESQFGILEALYYLGPLCQKNLADKLLKTGGNITMVIDNLEKRGFVNRKRGEKDRRLFNVHLTGEGKDLIEAVFPKHLKAVLEGMSCLTSEEQTEFQRMCKIIGLQKRNT